MVKLISQKNIITSFVDLAIIWLLPLMLNSLWIKVVTSAVIFALAAAGVSVLFAQLGLINLREVVAEFRTSC